MDKKQRMNSSYRVDYNQLMIELRKARKKEEADYLLYIPKPC